MVRHWHVYIKADTISYLIRNSQQHLQWLYTGHPYRWTVHGHRLVLVYTIWWRTVKPVLADSTYLDILSYIIISPLLILYHIILHSILSYYRFIYHLSLIYICTILFIHTIIHKHPVNNHLIHIVESLIVMSLLSLYELRVIEPSCSPCILSEIVFTLN